MSTYAGGLLAGVGRGGRHGQEDDEDEGDEDEDEEEDDVYEDEDYEGEDDEYEEDYQDEEDNKIFDATWRERRNF